MIATSLYIQRETSGTLRIFSKEPTFDTLPPFDTFNGVYTWILPKSVHEYFRRILPETGPVEFVLSPRSYTAIYIPTAKYLPWPKRTPLEDEVLASIPARFFIEKKSEGEFQMSTADPVLERLDPKDKENWVWLPSKWSPYFDDLLKVNGAIEYRITPWGAMQIIRTEEKIAKGLL